MVTPFKCETHTYDTVHVVTQDATFQAKRCSYCLEHKWFTAIRKLFRV